MFNKIKALFIKHAKSQESTSESDLSSPSYLHPITRHVMSWLDAQELKYTHAPSEEDDRTHHLLLRVQSEYGDFLCVFRIREHSQVLSLRCILPETVPSSHFALMLAKLSSHRLSFGSFELDLEDGELSALFYVDAEFTHLTDRALSSLFFGILKLSEDLYHLYQDVMRIKNPSSDLLDHVSPSDEFDFITPTHTHQ